MGPHQPDRNRRAADASEPAAQLEEAIRTAAFAAWTASREPHQSATFELFSKAYLGHYSTIDGYINQLIDSYQLDAKLDGCIAEPFRRHVDIDVTGFGRDLVANGTLSVTLAVPVGVWVFNGEFE